MTDTIELFPGVQFRKDMTKPRGNQWMFLHEEHWLIAKLAYSDDLFLDNVAKIVRERDALREAIATPESVFINMKAGRIAKVSLRSAIDLHGEVINGDDAQQLEIAGLRAEVEEWKGTVKFNEKCWSEERVTMIDKLQTARAEVEQLRHPAPPSDEIPDFSPGSGNKARRRAASLGIDMDAAMKPPLTERQCHDADCWLCEGTGQLDNGQPCDLNGKKVI